MKVRQGRKVGRWKNTRIERMHDAPPFNAYNIKNTPKRIQFTLSLRILSSLSASKLYINRYEDNKRNGKRHMLFTWFCNQWFSWRTREGGLMTPTLGLRANLPRGIRRSCYKAHGTMSKGLICLYSMEKLMRTKWRSDQPHNWNAFYWNRFPATKIWYGKAVNRTVNERM